MARADDVILPFEVGGGAVRGRVARLGKAVDDILSAHRFPDLLSALLGEASALAAMLGSALKFDGKLIFQAQGDGPVSMIVADYASGGALRATATAARPILSSAYDLSTLLGRGHAAITIDQGPDMERYQGVTPIEGGSLSAVAESYFARSEQIPTALRLAVGRVVEPGGAERWRAGGIMAQLMPRDSGVNDAIELDGWDRARAALKTTQADELVDPALPPEQLLFRLFHEDGVRAFSPLAVRAECPCSAGKIEAVLSRYSRDELAEMVEGGAIRVSCEFCRRAYSFDEFGRRREDP